MSESDKETKSMSCTDHFVDSGIVKPFGDHAGQSGRPPVIMGSEGARGMSKFVIAALAGMSVIFAQWLGGAIEGRLFPVMTTLQISDPTPYPPPNYRTRWRGESVKQRACEFVRLEWFLGPRKGPHVQITSEFVDQPQIRGTGLIQWDGIVVSLPPSEVLANSYADIIHQCPYRPWETRTRFYDSGTRQ